MKKKVAFMGLGVMGYPMAGHIPQQHYEVTVYNRTPEKRQKWCKEYGGKGAVTPMDAVQGADVVLMCVGDDADIAALTLGDAGVLKGMKRGAILVDHTTASCTIAQKLAHHAQDHGIGFLDAPISGGQIGAETGKLTIMVGGEKNHFDQAVPVMDSYARYVRLLGGVGSGQLTKMVNQICIGGLIQALAEGLNFAKKAGLDIEAVIETLSKGAAQSWQMENRYKTMDSREYNHGFAVDLMRKDLGLCLQEAHKRGAALPVTALVDQFYAQVQKKGGARWDTSSLLTLLEEEK